MPCDEPVLNARLVYFEFIILGILIFMCIRGVHYKFSKGLYMMYEEVVDNFFSTYKRLDVKQTTVNASSTNIDTYDK